jgi:hypothetical protein
MSFAIIRGFTVMILIWFVGGYGAPSQTICPLTPVGVKQPMTAHMHVSKVLTEAGGRQSTTEIDGTIYRNESGDFREDRSVTVSGGRPIADTLLLKNTVILDFTKCMQIDMNDKSPWLLERRLITTDQYPEPLRVLYGSEMTANGRPIKVISSQSADLGEKQIEGIETHGTQVTTTYEEISNPASRHTETREKWVSTAKSIVLHETVTNPDFGSESMLLDHLDFSEPQISAFEIPANKKPRPPGGSPVQLGVRPK